MIFDICDISLSVLGLGNGFSKVCDIILVQSLNLKAVLASDKGDGSNSWHGVVMLIIQMSPVAAIMQCPLTFIARHL